MKVFLTQWSSAILTCCVVLMAGSVQAQVVRRTECGNRISFTLNPQQLGEEVDLIWDSLNTALQLGWGGTIARSASPGQNVDFYDFNASNIGELSADSAAFSQALWSPLLFIDSIQPASGSNLDMSAGGDLSIRVGDDYEITNGAYPHSSRMRGVSDSFLDRSQVQMISSSYDFFLDGVEYMSWVQAMTEDDKSHAESYATYRDSIGTTSALAKLIAEDGGEVTAFMELFSNQANGRMAWVEMKQEDWASSVDFVLNNNEGNIDIAADTLVVAGDASVSRTLFADSLVVADVIAGQISSLANHTTDQLTEGATNLYFTDARARGAMTAGTGVTLNAGQISIGQDVSTTSDVAFDEVQADSVDVASVLTSPMIYTDSIQPASGSNLDMSAGGDLSIRAGDDYEITNGAYPHRSRLRGVSDSFLDRSQVQMISSSYDFFLDGVEYMSWVQAMTEDDKSHAESYATYRDSIGTTSALAKLIAEDGGEVTAFMELFSNQANGRMAWVEMKQEDWASSVDFVLNNNEGNIDIAADTLVVAGDASVSRTLFADSLVVADVIEGQISSLANHTTDQLTEGATNLYFTDARARAAISVNDTGGAGSLAYDSTTGVITYAGPDTAAIRGHFTAGEGIAIASGEVAVHADLLARIDSLEGVISALNTAQESADFRCGTSTVSYDGYAYRTVQVGSQCWFAENLRTATYIDGREIPSGLDDTAWEAATAGAMTVYDEGGADEERNLALYGRMYNWYAASSDSLCPSGWHVPSRDEWNTLATLLGGDAASAPKLKAAECDWPAWDGINSCGFGATPGGQRYPSYFSIGTTAYYWTSTELDAVRSYRVDIGTEYDDFYASKFRGASVRCLKNDPLPSSVVTLEAPAVGETTATIAGLLDVPFNANLMQSGLIWGSTPDLASATDTLVAPVNDSLVVGLTGLTAGTTYHYVAYATTNGGTRYGDTLSFTTTITPAVFYNCGDEIFYNGYNYETVSANGKCWFKENLQTLKYRDGSDILVGIGDDNWNQPAVDWSGRGEVGENDSIAKYGRIYNWFTTQQDLCPDGWRVPLQSDFEGLIAAFGGNGSFADPNAVGAKSALLAASEGGTDASGMSMIGLVVPPAFQGDSEPGKLYKFWNSSPLPNANAFPSYLFIWQSLNYVSASVTDSPNGIGSIRCIELDEE